MDKRKTTLMGGSVLVLALVAALGIVYAAYSQSLTINGTASVKANSWDIHFANLSEATLTGDAQVVTVPTIKNNSTEIGDYSVLLSKPGDSVTFNFELVNDGTFDAWSGIVSTTIKCTGTGDNAEDDALKVCDHLTYLIDVDGDEEHYNYYDGLATKDDYIDTLVELPAKSILNIGLTLEYDSNIPANELPKNDVAISGLGLKFNVTQQ